MSLISVFPSSNVFQHRSRFATEGIVLDRFYCQPICTPSRASLLTSRYALALGLQGKETVQQGQSWGLPLDEQTFLPTSFKAAGWATHLVGKFHLGADYWARTPTYRGFDSFTGYLYGAEVGFFVVPINIMLLRDNNFRSFVRLVYSFSSRPPHSAA